MPVPFVLCRNEVTGAEADIAETSLPHMTDWVPIGRPEPDADPVHTPADPASTPPAGEQPTPRTPKTRKAADTATTEKE